MTYSSLLVIWTLLVACKPAPEETSGSPSLWIDGALLAFDRVDIGLDEPRVETLWVQNVGYGLLTVETPYFAEDGPFSVPGERVTLERMEAHGYEVTFDPRTPFLHEGSLLLESNDAAVPLQGVEVVGEAFAPVLEVSTSPIDLREQVGCAAVAQVEVANGGNEVLVVTPSLDSTSKAELFLPAGGMPEEIEPGTSATIAVAYVPTGTFPDSAALTLESNDPLRPSATIDVTGAVQELDTQTDAFEIQERVSDIVLVVDNSGSMDWEQPQLAEHIGSFVEGLDEAGVDYRIGVISTDTPWFYGSVGTPATTDAAAVLADQVTEMGTHGSGTGRGLQMLYNCVQLGGDCSEDAGFMREDGLFVGVIISDGPDQSALNPEGYVEYFWTLKDDPDLVRIHAITGSIPVVTCGTCASPGFGYDEALELTAGTWLDICADDWSESLRALAEQSYVEADSVQLSQDPVANSIEVLVDGGPWWGGWAYDDGTNEITFHDPLPIPSVLEVTYTVTADCE